jgi:hypothetical protein
MVDQNTLTEIVSNYKAYVPVLAMTIAPQLALVANIIYENIFGYNEPDFPEDVYMDNSLEKKAK